MGGASGETIKQRARKAREQLRTLGPWNLLERSLRKVTRPWLDSGSLTFFVNRSPAGDAAQLSPGFEIRELFPSDKEAVLYGSESGWEKLLARFHTGDRCFGALDAQGRAVHTRWVTFVGTAIPELGMRFVPAPDTAYFYDGYTRPDARRQGIDPVVRDAIFRAARAQGRTRVYSYVRNDNSLGLRAASRAQDVSARVRYLRLLGAAPRVLGGDQLPGATLVPLATTADEAARRGADWRAWFEGWLKEPLASRSIGFHQLPDAAFKATADHIRATLSLDPSTDRVLDVGCDSALVTQHVSPHCRSLVGVDFVPGMLIDARRARIGKAILPAVPHFAAADGRSLPFPSDAFSMAYCTGVVHTLPTLEHAVAMILEMVRVVAPGGRILVGALPDVHKRGAGRKHAWRVGGARERARLLAAMVVPARVRGVLRDALSSGEGSPLRYLEFDLEALTALLRRRGVECATVHYPADYWSRDFRVTRSNLVITVPRQP
jgi:SAM-dependent methyltransferase/ribosomal protein S18 acetylase RimI-like enzyme